jgi:hypothetical protein
MAVAPEAPLDRRVAGQVRQGQSGTLGHRWADSVEFFQKGLHSPFISGIIVGFALKKA